MAEQASGLHEIGQIRIQVTEGGVRPMLVDSEGRVRGASAIYYTVENIGEAHETIQTGTPWRS